MNAHEEYQIKSFDETLEQGKLPRPKRPWDRMAFQKFGGKFSGNDFLLSAKLPVGWRTARTAMYWGQLFDEQGRSRAHFFYKARVNEAYFEMTRRYTTWQPYTANRCAWDNATNTVLFEPSSSDSDIAGEQVRAWLDEHYPNWLDPSRYWDDIPTNRRWWHFWS